MMVYHAINRGNGRMRLFYEGEDFDAFERVARVLWLGSTLRRVGRPAAAKADGGTQ